MKIKLLNDGGWDFLDFVKFPVEVEGVIEHECGMGDVATITSAELKRIGATLNWRISDNNVWWFRLGSECEVLS